MHSDFADRHPECPVNPPEEHPIAGCAPAPPPRKSKIKNQHSEIPNRKSEKRFKNTHFGKKIAVFFNFS